MSKWYEPKLKEWKVSDDGKEIQIWIDSDDFGNIYVSLPAEDIKQFLEDNKGIIGVDRTKYPIIDHLKK